MFAEAYLNAQRNMVESKSDLDRLKFMPQKIEGGTVLDFKGNTVFKDIDSKDLTIFDADRVNTTKRCTSALVRDYFLALDKVMPLFNRGGESTEQAAAEPKEEYGADILALISSGDKKGLRTLLKEYMKVKWVNLDEDSVEDAVDDLKDCLDDKDVDGAKEIINELISDDICETKVEDTPTPTPTPTQAAEPKHEPANEDEAELLQDLEEAVEDKDWEDVELLLKELGDAHPRHAEFSSKLPGATKEVKADTPAPTKEDEDDAILDEICEDIDNAIADKELGKAKDFLIELKAEVGEDDTLYKEYEAKVNPPKERTRRARRGN